MIGTIRQFVIDDKGAVAIVAFGVPPFYHENNGTLVLIFHADSRTDCDTFSSSAVRSVKTAVTINLKKLKASIG